jgi:hypothetical protein
LLKGAYITSIPHKWQDYETVGNWMLGSEGSFGILVSATGDWKYDALIAVHELVEAILCRARGIYGEQLDEFDMAWTGDGEPGDAPDAIYQNEHNFATAVERMLCAALGIKWADYGAAIEKVMR